MSCKEQDETVLRRQLRQLFEHEVSYRIGSRRAVDQWRSDLYEAKLLEDACGRQCVVDRVVKPRPRIILVDADHGDCQPTTIAAT